MGYIIFCRFPKQSKKTIVGGKWHYQPQEQDGDYWFDGMVIVTANMGIHQYSDKKVKHRNKYNMI